MYADSLNGLSFVCARAMHSFLVERAATFTLALLCCVEAMAGPIHLTLPRFEAAPLGINGIDV